MKTFRAVALSLLLSTSCLASTASALTADQAMPAAIAWLQANTDYKNIPAVRYWVSLTVDQMATQAIKSNIPGDHRRIVAIYSCTQHTMYLRSDLDYDELDPFATLIHEMTHHAQCEANRPMGDKCAVEREAYHNQAEWGRTLPNLYATKGRELNPAQIAGIMAAADRIEAVGDYACGNLRNR